MTRLASVASRLASALRTWSLGISADEIRYTFEDVRAELRATRADLQEQIAALRRDLDRLEGRPGAPVAQDRDEPAAKV